MVRGALLYKRALNALIGRPMLRRSLLSATAAFLSIPVLPRLTSAAPAAADRQILHVLDRLAFGPTDEDFRRVKAIGIGRYIAEQLAPETLPEPAALTERLAGFETLWLDPIELFVRYGPLRPVGGVKPSREEQMARRKASQIIVREAAEARVLRALYSPRQLEQVMVDFWFNHFNVFAQKGLDHLWIGAYEEAAIRRHALGRFGDLLLATARHPAMLFYLDNWQNSAPGSRMPNGREVGINENYAREVMELHTLGVDGGYTQADVIALARILTGWGLLRPRMPPPDRTGFYFDPTRHDSEAKLFLGRTIPASGEAEGVEALDMLAKSPATARHIGFELAQYFVADMPPPALVERLAGRFRDSGGDIGAVLKTLFARREFADSIGAKYKTPYQFVLSAARASGRPVQNPRPLLGTMARSGMPLYGCLTPDGYKNTEDAWLSPDATNLRISFATALAGGGMPLDQVPPVIPVAAMGPGMSGTSEPPPTRGPPVDAAALETLLASTLSPRTRAAVDATAPGLRAAMLLGGPDFMRR
jgi:hypothetical protein